MVDDERFERVWRTHGASLLRYCRFAVASPEIGEDLAAETFAAFLQKGDRVADEHVEAWLFTVARNACRSHHRRSTRWDLLLPQLMQPSEAATGARTHTDVIALLEPLTSDERLAVYLRIVEERPFAEVAKVLRKSRDATKKIVYRALRRLRCTLEPATPGVLHDGGVENE